MTISMNPMSYSTRAYTKYPLISLFCGTLSFLLGFRVSVVNLFTCQYFIWMFLLYHITDLGTANNKNDFTVYWWQYRLHPVSYYTYLFIISQDWILIPAESKCNSSIKQIMSILTFSQMIAISKHLSFIRTFLLLVQLIGFRLSVPWVQGSRVWKTQLPLVNVWKMVIT